MDPARWERDPDGLLFQVALAARLLNEAVVRGPEDATLTPFASPGVLLVIAQLGDEVRRDPNPFAISALVRFFNFNLWIQAVER